MEVAIGLGILVSELTADAFKHRLLTFEDRPQWVDLSSCETIADKVRKVKESDWGMSTNFEAACELILATCERHKLPPDEVPDLLVLSDMQFNQAISGGSWETHHERLQRRFAEVGRAVCGQPYAAPRIIYWNLRGNTVGFPADARTPNTQMLAGFSPSLLKLVMTGGELGGEEEVEVVRADGVRVVVKKGGPTPEETLRKALDDPAFDAVRLRLSELSTGLLADYAFAKEELGFEVLEAGAEAGAEAPAEAEAESDGELVVVE